MGLPKAFLDGNATLPVRGGKAAHGVSIRAARKDHVHPLWNVNQLLAYKAGLDMNVTTDQLLTNTWDFSGADGILITAQRVVDASASLTTAKGSVYTKPAKGGIALSATTAVFTALTGATLGDDTVIQAAGKDMLLPASFDAVFQFYLALTTAQGGAATAALYLFGIPFKV